MPHAASNGESTRIFGLLLTSPPGPGIIDTVARTSESVVDTANVIGTLCRHQSLVVLPFVEQRSILVLPW